MTLYDIVLSSHIAIGAVALGAFWTTAALRKGTRLHRRVGGTYLVAMLGIVVTALPLAGHAFAAGHTTMGVFLAYLVLITGTALWIAWWPIRHRQSAAAYMGSWYRPLAWVNVACGAAVMGLGLYTGELLLDGMSVIGLVAGRQMLGFAARAPRDPRWWLQSHYRGMVASGIGAHIAFLNIGLQRIVPGGWAAPARYVAWFGPVVAAAVAIAWLNRRYGRGPDGARLVMARGGATAKAGAMASPGA